MKFKLTKTEWYPYFDFTEGRGLQIELTEEEYKWVKKIMEEIHIVQRFLENKYDKK